MKGATHNPDETGDGGNVGPDTIAATPPSPRNRRRGRELYCFSCNRQETHSLTAPNKAIYLALIIFTFGMYYLFGTYRCHCCANARLTRHNWTNLRYWYREMQLKNARPHRSRRRRKGKSKRNKR